MRALSIISISLLILTPVSLHAQTADPIRIPGEFIESSSPLPGGGSVTSRAIPGRGVQTFVEIASLPKIERSQSITAGRSLQNTSRPTSTRITYPYPETRNRIPGRLTAAHSAQSSATPPQTLQPRTAYQLSPQYRTAQANCNCGPTNLGAPPANFAPSLDIQVPGQTGVATGQDSVIYGGNTLQLPPVTNQPNQVGSSFSRWWNPIWTGSGAYQPVIPFRNMSPGTYLGQGIVGQPTAYVDGQPIRNLLRYIFP